MTTTRILAAGAAAWIGLALGCADPPHDGGADARASLRGAVASLDAGTSAPGDAGVQLPGDAGLPPGDAGLPPGDAGLPPGDAGVPAADGGVPDPPDQPPPLPDPPPEPPSLPPPPPGCAALPAVAWDPGASELDGRSWQEERLTRASSDEPYRWTRSFAGPVAELRLAPPVYLDLPSYEVGLDLEGQVLRCGPVDVAQAWFVAGIYTAEVRYEDGRPADLFVLFAGADTPVKDPAPTVPGARASLGGDDPCPGYSRYAEIPAAEIEYDRGAFVIETPDKDEGGALDKSVAIMGNRAVRAGSVAEAVEKLNAAYDAASGPIAAVLDGHGAPSDQSVGAGQISTRGKYLWLKGHADNRTFVDGMTDTGARRKIRRLTLLGCCVARNVTDWVDQHLLCDMARGLAPSDDTWVRAWTTRNGGVEPSWRRRGYFTSAGPTWNQNSYTIRKGHCDSWRR